MPGGLLQIASFGNQDIFLTGNPEITYFKYVYRRYTNFSIETLEQFPDGIVNFGEKITFTLSKNADLVHKVYLKIEIPKVDIYKAVDANAVNIAKNNYEEAKTNWINLNKYSNYIIEAYNLIYKELQPINADPLLIYNDLVSFFQNDIDLNDYTNVVNTIKPAIKNTTDIREQIKIIVNSILSRDEKLKKISYLIDQIKKYLINKNNIYYFYDPDSNIDYPNRDDEDPLSVLYTKKIYEETSTTRYKFAWIKKLGHYIIKKIEVDIGGTIIDRHYNDWINIWHELTKVSFKETIYDKMIGNISELTTYNNKAKPNYILYLPLSFWFNQYNGISIPLVALKYQDVKINIEINDLINCIISEYKNLNIDNLIKIINTSLYIDYVYLDQIERKKFAYGIHEYIIPQIQTEIFRDNNTQQITCSFNTLYPTKELIWIAKKKINRSYNNLDTNIDWSNYSIKIGNISYNPIKSAHIELSGYERFKKIDGIYFNYTQPYEYHTATPSDGINVYSFALKPEDNQPSGSCNMTRHEAKNLRLEFMNDFITELGDEYYIVKLYSINYNVLRFMGGMCSLAFLY